MRERKLIQGIFCFPLICAILLSTPMSRTYGQSPDSLQQTLADTSDSQEVAPSPDNMESATQSPPLDHEKRFFKSEDQKLYVAKSLPIYLHISTSPDLSGESYLLRSDSTAQYANPLYLDTEGVNYIRTHAAVDPATKEVLPNQEIVFEVYADGLPPKSTLSFTGAESFVDGNVQYFGKGLQAMLESVDYMSGLNAIYYSINGRPFSPYQTPMTTFNSDTMNNIRYYAVDNVGNAEHPREQSFIYDRTSPLTDMEISGPKSDQYISASTRFILTSSDELSGVASTQFKLDDREAREYDGPVDPSGLSDGQHVLSYFANDEVDNTEETRQYDFILDTTPPEAEVSVEADQYAADDLTYLSSRSRLQLTSRDKDAGVESIKYAIDDGSYEEYLDRVIMPTSPGNYTVTYRATDVVGNRSTDQTFPVYLDKRAPETSHSFSEPNYQGFDTLYISPSTTIELTSEDDASGVQTIRYRLDSGDFETYTQPIAVESEGFHSVEFYADDQVNNREQTKTIEFYVDTTPPVINTMYSSKATFDPNRNMKVIPRRASIFLAAFDEQTDLQTLTYSINGKESVPYSGPIKGFDSNETLNIKIIATDKVQNRSTETLKFYVQ